jgi:transcriptional regulator with XRE-family HTH domain
MKKKTKRDNELCAAVRRIRNATGDTQEKFAQRIGVAVMTISRFETARQVPRHFRVLSELRDVARAAGLDVEESILSGVLTEHPSSSLGQPQEFVTFTPAEWRLMHAARIAVRFYPETARAIEEAAAPTLALVDEILRYARPDRVLTAGFYMAMEDQLDELAERRSFEYLRRERNQ